MHGTSYDAKLHGTRSYVPGLALDQPLGLWDGRVFNPSWRGVFESSVWADGTAGDASVGGGTGTVVDWPAAKGVYWTPSPGSGDAMPPAYAWLGDLAIDGAQSTGQLYRRNRFYDPASGQFTQADPIGLAGGSSLFGFAGGDPINFADPFGLLVCPPLCDSFNPENDRFILPRSGTEALALGAIALAAAGGGVALAVAGTATLAALAPAAPAVGGGTMKLIDALRRAGPSMDARMGAVLKSLRPGDTALQTIIENGGKMLSGGSGDRARQVILNADGSTVVKAFNESKKVYEVVETIVPPNS